MFVYFWSFCSISLLFLQDFVQKVTLYIEGLFFSALQ